MSNPTPIDELRQIVARLRGPGGCPWDREQTHASLRGCLLEEAHEVVEAIDEGNDAHLCEELGDVLLQVVLHSEMASETGRFDLDAVARGLSEKLIRRHPHVFGEAQVAGSSGVIQQWDAIKRTEKGDKPASLLAGVSTAHPALMHAAKITKKAARVGFDWENAPQVIEKIREELAETEEAFASTAPDRQERLEEEIGDLLFSVVNFARKVNVEPELALRRASGKFTKRFQRIEAKLQAQGRSVEACSFEELDAIWDQVKAEDRECQKKD